MPDRSDFDLSPDPRILPMLGEINLAQWKCLAELVDNSIDAFLKVGDTGNEHLHYRPEVSIQVPTIDDPKARISVRDNAPGMTEDELERAVRAGWTGNDPINNLGMFGMGFNIATARLGTVTTVWTTQAGDNQWVGLRIDFDELRKQRHFRTPRLQRPKADPADHGTEITIERLKPEQRDWFSKASNRTRVRNELASLYSAMLVKGDPISFRLKLGGKYIEGRRHCIWGDELSAQRIIHSPRFGDVNAVQIIRHSLPDRLFCTSCWQWLGVDETTCGVCLSANNVVTRKRAVRGWIGIQRYLSESHYGIDLLRHGRKIESLTKDLFEYEEEREYPIDDPRGRGRIVGELHLDHCRVTYTKDRFDRTDPAWSDMLLLVRGEGPLRPEKARQAGVADNQTPLFILYQLFRRNSPKPKVAGAYERLLVVPDNEKAVQMFNRFSDGDPDYQSDEKWFELVQEEDRKLLRGPTPPPTDNNDTGSDVPDGFAPSDTPQDTNPTPPTPPPAAPVLHRLPSLSADYRSEITRDRWSVDAYDAIRHPALADEPWLFRARSSGGYEFLVNTSHPVFASATLTPLDALLAQLAASAMDFLRGQHVTATFAAILSDLRDRYATSTSIDPVTLTSEARQTLSAISTVFADRIDADDSKAVFESLTSSDQDEIYRRMATRSVADHQAAIFGGRFLQYASPRVVATVFAQYPELFLDGRCWDDSYSTLDYGRAAATEEAQHQVRRHYQSLLSDAVWLAEQDPADLARYSRARLLRAQLALELLAPVPSAEELAS